MTDGYELVKSKIKFIKFKNHSIAARNDKLSGKEFDINLYEKYRESTYVSLSEYQSFKKDVYIITPDRRFIVHMYSLYTFHIDISQYLRRTLYRLTCYFLPQ